MSNEFLADYRIPILQPPADATISELPHVPVENQESVVTLPEYSTVNRFIPPGLQGSNYVPPEFPRKRKLSNTSKPMDTLEVSDNGEIVMFTGRDASYPNELNMLIQPMFCELCNTKANSRNSAKDHYFSKAHDRKIAAWLKQNYTDKGLDPPAVKRFIKEGPSGPDAFHCQVCDLKLNSLTHANQHYAGRRHRLVANKISQPSGAGYYNAEGNWVRTGTKYTPNTKNDGRFGIGEQFKLDGNETTLPESSSKIEAGVAVKDEAQPLALFCQICKVNTTSEPQMKMHLEGSKHKKKLRALGLETTSIHASAGDNVTSTDGITANVTILESINEKIDPKTDLSMYRTPSGSYYCKICNLSLGHVTALQEHLKGKKHAKKVSEANSEKKSA